jgi:sulfatase maturation enzyme AslB (radical SAM superfamily)
MKPPMLRALRQRLVPPGAVCARTLGTPVPSAATTLVDGRAINFFFTRKCNYACKFCFHTAKSSHVLSEADCKRVLRLFREAGAVKLNIAGGEPLLPQYHGLVGSAASPLASSSTISSS